MNRRPVVFGNQASRRRTTPLKTESVEEFLARGGKIEVLLEAERSDDLHLTGSERGGARRLRIRAAVRENRELLRHDG